MSMISTNDTVRPPHPWNCYQSATLSRSTTLPGSVVRISPTETSLSHPTTLHTLHLPSSGFLKSPWYASFAQEYPPNQGIFVLSDPKVHAGRRRFVAPGFGRGYLVGEWGGVIHGLVKRGVEGMGREGAGGGKVDLLAWWTFMVRFERLLRCEA